MFINDYLKNEKISTQWQAQYKNITSVDRANVSAEIKFSWFICHITYC